MIREEFKIHRDAAGKRSRKIRCSKTKVQSVRVRPMVWRYVKKTVGGDWSRVEVVSETVVLIRNPR